MICLLTHRWLPVLSTLLLVTCLVTAVETRSIAVGAAQKETTIKSDASQLDVAKLLLEIRTQQVAVAKAELDMLGASQQAADQKVNLMSANLAVEKVNSENVDSLFDKKVVSRQEKELQAAKRSAAEASLMIAKAESDGAAKSIVLKKARIVLLELRMNLAETELKHRERELQELQPVK